jgi:hypothetical protein
MSTLRLAFMIVAVFLFLMAAFNVSTPGPRVNYMAGGLALWAVATLLA